MAIPDEHIAELVESMQAMGQLVPLIVMPSVNTEDERELLVLENRIENWLHDGGMFEIIDGHCRWLASPQVPLEELSCSVFTDVAEAKHAMMLHAGIMRLAFTPYEEGRQFIELGNKYHWSLEQICKTFQRSEHYVNARVDVAEGYEEVCLAVQAREINLAQATQINRAKNDSLRMYLLDQAKVHGATARTIEVMRHNWEKENIFAATGVMPHTAENSVKVDPPAEPECLWCGEGGGMEHFRQVTVHWYCLRPLNAVVDQVGSKNLLRGNVAGAAG
jgi:ParB-like chromosome segregation protein Spo0J